MPIPRRGKKEKLAVDYPFPLFDHEASLLRGPPLMLLLLSTFFDGSIFMTSGHPLAFFVIRELFTLLTIGAPSGCLSLLFPTVTAPSYCHCSLLLSSLSHCHRSLLLSLLSPVTSLSHYHRTTSRHSKPMHPFNRPPQLFSCNRISQTRNLSASFGYMC